MRILSAHKEHGPGHAWLSMDHAVTPETALVIERETDKDRYLGSSGWQSVPENLPVDAVDGGRMLLGPTIVDHLGEGDFIKVAITGTGYFEEDFWPVVPISGRKSSGFGIVSSKPSADAHQKAGPSDLAVNVKGGGAKQSAAPTDDEAGAETAGAGAAKGRHYMPGETISIDPSLIAFADPSITEKPSTRISRKTIVGLAGFWVLIAVCLLGWYYSPYLLAGLDSFSQQAEQTPVEEPVVTPAPTPAQTPSATPAPTPQEPQVARGRSYWQQQMMSGQMSGQQLYEASEETADNADLSDMSAEFLRLASNKGYAPALRSYAERYDPTKPDAAGASVIKNANTALDAYTRLKAGGDANAAADIQTLCQFLEPKYYQDAEARTAVDDYCR
ncbi:hypothetical protein [Cohaesibacter marisflavi]|uniref:hypothetical protein n=1 Tax=Cohaesibacter marisflavi TaxID=655353 RepID=UPI0029C60FDE|nr:hypothetical protein [Cohaesibacter marisflavi]